MPIKRFFRCCLPVLLAAALIIGLFAGCSTGISDTGDGGGTAGTAISENGEYTSAADVALYIYTYHSLPDNYITKNEARSLGWDSEKGNLDEVAPGKSIGGDKYGNYEKKLPEHQSYKECDVNYHGGYRGAERLIFTEDGDVYYTADHYNTFTKLY